MKKSTSRRKFLKDSAKGAAGAFIAANLPTIVPSTVFGKYAPSNRINVGAIGCGRISTGHDVAETIRHNEARIMAVCDLDSRRVQLAKDNINSIYSKQTGKSYDGVATYENFHDLLANKDVDAVLLSLPDHWHTPCAVNAVRAGKDVYMQKPASLTISEGRLLCNEVKKHGRILQVGSQQRSMPQFRRACELVRNGRIGKVHTVYIGLPIDNPAEATVEHEMPVPSNLNYDMWLGTTPEVWYTEKRVHPQNSITARPGWLRCEQFGAGMITGWGAHHFDIMNWGLGTEYTGPSEISGTAEWPPKGVLWDVHGSFHTETIMPGGVRVLASDKYPNGVKFEGSDGWIFVTRGAYAATASDPAGAAKNTKALDASNPKILESVIGPNEIHFVESTDHHLNWLQAVAAHKDGLTPIEVGHRACSLCLLSWASFKLGRKLYWDPVKEQFKNDAEANKLLSRAQRKKYAVYAS